MFRDLIVARFMMLEAEVRDLIAEREQRSGNRDNVASRKALPPSAISCTKMRFHFGRHRKVRGRVRAQYPFRAADFGRVLIVWRGSSVQK